MNKKQINIISLFSGCGCVFEAFKEMGCEVNGVSSDIEYSYKDGKRKIEGKYAMQVESKNFPQIEQLGDVLKVNVKGDYDILVGGFPCQAFSIAGKRNGLEDPRGQLYKEAVRIINETKPEYFLLENVKGILSAKYQEKKVTDIIAEDLWGIQPQLIKGGLISAQNRDRVWWFGKLQKDGTYKQISIPTLEDMGFVLKDILETRKNVAEKFYLSQKNADSYDKVSSLEQKDLYAKNKKSHTLNTSYGSVQLKDTVESKRRTLVIEKHYISEEKIQELKEKDIYVSEPKEDEFGVYITMIRKLTPIECERLMGLPDNCTKYDEDGNIISDSQRYKMLGNAFQVQVIKWIWENR